MTNKTVIADAGWIRLVDILDDKGKSKWVYATRRRPEDLDAPAFPDAVVIVPIHVDEDNNKTLVLTKEWRHPINDYELGFPAGLIDEDEFFADSAARELKEETGFEVTHVHGNSPLLYSSAGLSDESCTILFVQCKGSNDNKNLQGGEDIETIMCSPDDLPELLKDRKIKWSAKAWPIAMSVSILGNFDFLDEGNDRWMT